jgi:hypothetical protein
MATGSEAVKVADEAVLEWNKHDSKRMLRAVYRVGDLDCTPSGLSTSSQQYFSLVINQSPPNGTFL